MARHRRGFVYSEARLEARWESKGSMSEKSNDAYMRYNCAIYFMIFCEVLVKLVARIRKGQPRPLQRSQLSPLHYRGPLDEFN